MKTQNNNRVQLDPRRVRQNLTQRAASHGQMITGDTVASSKEAIYQVEGEDTDQSADD